MINKTTIVTLLLFLALLASRCRGGGGDSAGGQSQAAGLGPFSLTGLADIYYSMNFNHPASGSNQLRNFDVNANQFGLNMLKIALERPAEPLGLRVDLGFGRAFEIMHATESAPAAVHYLEQAFISYKPGAAGGLQLDAGKYVTSAGAEVIETNANWNYSRSLLFAYAIPYYHFGVRATMPLGRHFTAGAQLANGWNNVQDNNSGKTAGFTAAVNVSRFTWSQTYYVGPENAGARGLRHLYDTVLLVNAAPAAGFYVNFDYGVNRNPAAGPSRWTGVAGAARIAVSKRFAVSPRLEWFDDADGFSTGSVQKLKEFTLTGETALAKHLSARLEFRRDWSDRAFFDRGGATAASRSQVTLLGGVVAVFPPGR